MAAVDVVASQLASHKSKENFENCYSWVANLKLCFWEGHVEGDCKCGQQKHGENDHIQKSNKNFSKHDNVDARAGKFGTESD